MLRVLIANLAPCIIEEQPLQAQQGPDHVFANPLCLALGLRSDLAMDVETCVAPGEDLLDQRKADELFPKQQRKDLMGEKIADGAIMEAATGTTLQSMKM